MHKTTKDSRDSLEGTNGNKGDLGTNTIMIDLFQVVNTSDRNANELDSICRPEVSTARPDIDAAKQEDSTKKRGLEGFHQVKKVKRSELDGSTDCKDAENAILLHDKAASRDGKGKRGKRGKTREQQKTDSDLEEEEQLRASLKIVPDEEEEIDYEVLGTRMRSRAHHAFTVKEFVRFARSNALMETSGDIRAKEPGLDSCGGSDSSENYMSEMIGRERRIEEYEYGDGQCARARVVRTGKTLHTDGGVRWTRGNMKKWWFYERRKWCIEGEGASLGPVWGGVWFDKLGIEETERRTLWGSSVMRVDDGADLTLRRTVLEGQSGVFKVTRVLNVAIDLPTALDF
ncbi:hypothetical protein Tco_1531730 [Tanacetum coccineum]